MFGLFAVIAAIVGLVMGLYALGTYQLWLLIALFLLFFILHRLDLYWIVSVVAVTWSFIAMFSFATFIYFWIFIIVCLFLGYLFGEFE